MIIPPPSPRYPWHEHADQAAQWAARYVSISRWDKARAEGWERPLKLWAQSYAHECYRLNAEPNLSARPSNAEIEYWQRVCREPKPTSPASIAADTMSDSDFVDGIADGTIELNGMMARTLRRMAQKMKARRSDGSKW